MGFLLDQRLLVIKEFSRGTDDINYCCEHNILVTKDKQSRKLIVRGWVLCPTSVSRSSCRVPSSLLPSLTQHLNSQLCYFCQVWSDCFCLLRSCLLQSLSRPSAGLASKRTVLTTEALEALTIHSLSLHDTTYQCSPAARASASILLVKVQFRHFETYCRAEWGATRENREEICDPSPPHPPRTALRGSNSGLLLLNSKIHKFILGELSGGVGILCFLSLFFYYTVYLFWSKLDIFCKII